MGDFEVVILDVETTGFTKDAEIIQIAASNGNSAFNVYITPTKSIHWKATEVTGLEFKNGHLLLHGKRVHSISAKKAFKSFMNYLRRIKREIVLVAHNCFGFDMPRILKLAAELRLLNQFRKLVYGFSDSLVILRSILCERRAGKGKFTLKALVQDFVPYVDTNNLHNALHDVQSLQSLLFKSGLGVSEDLVVQWSKNIDQYFREQEIKKQVTEAKQSLQCFKNTLPTWIINKMAKTRIDINLLKNIYDKDGFEGIRRLFSKNYYGRPRVTRTKKIITNVCNAIHNDLYVTF